MSRNYLAKEEAINQLYATIKSKFEQDGVLQEVRCMLQSKMVAMMKGKSDVRAPMVSRGGACGGASTTGSGDASASDGVGDARLQLLNQLIMEYFHWHGYHYAAEMFATESGSDNTRPLRESLEGALGGDFEHRTIPILVELVAELIEKKKNNTNG